ncbi:MAG TPA: hypothetical protein VFM96_08920 [Gaiellaceae bacterium]|nr:hypothetical protein [Gaiellaceae bacterium]
MARSTPVASGAPVPRRLIIAVLACAALAAGLWLGLRPSPAPPRLLVGVDDDTLKWTPYPLTVVRRQRALGADAVRVWVPWQGETAPNAVRRDELARAEAAARTTTVVLAVFGFWRETPLTSVTQSRFCNYAHDALALVPHARAVVVWNEANAPMYWRGTPAQYESLLARCYDVLHRRGLTVLDSTASAHRPIKFLDAVARAYRASGRKRPLVDAFGHNPYPLRSAEPPTVLHAGDFLGEGDYRKLVDALSGFGRSPAIWYLEDGFQTTQIAPALQARDIAVAIGTAACQPHVRAFFNFELVDETRAAGWHSGLIWRSGKQKPAAAAFARAPRTCRP